jgi:hypothetical protein
MLYLDATINVMLPIATHGHDSSFYKIKKLKLYFVNRVAS